MFCPLYLSFLKVLSLWYVPASGTFFCFGVNKFSFKLPSNEEHVLRRMWEPGEKKHQSFKKSRAGEWDKTKQSLFSVLKAPVSRVLTVCRGGRNHQMPCEGTSAATVGRFLLKCFTTNGTHFFLTAPRGMWDLSSPTRDGIQAPCSGSVKSNH